jgi:hypothetical protein
MGYFGTIQKPKSDPCEVSQPKYINIIIIGLKYHWVNQRNSWSPTVTKPALKPNFGQLVHRPQRPESPAVCLWAQGLFPVGLALCHLLIIRKENNELLPPYTY